MEIFRGNQVLKLLSRRPGDPPTDDEAAQASESAAPQSPSREFVQIDVLPDHIPWSAAAASPASPSPAFFNGPRPIRAIDNTVTFKCGTALPANSYSAFKVYQNGAVVHEETNELSMASSSCMPGQWTAEVECIFYYSTRLVPKFWLRICQCSGRSPVVPAPSSEL